MIVSCDHGLAPPPIPPLGSVDVSVTYRGNWPPSDSLKDLRFVAFRFVPRDTTDFFRLNEILFSPTLPMRVPEHRMRIDSVEAGEFVYSGIAQRFSNDLLDWRPLGLYEDNGGSFTIGIAETTYIAIDVDFGNLPPFPPK